MATEHRKLYRITYRLDEHETATWHTRAFDRDHAIERFCEADDGWDYSDIVTVECIPTPSKVRS